MEVHFIKKIFIEAFLGKQRFHYMAGYVQNINSWQQIFCQIDHHAVIA